MARKIRIEYAGACYHVINRGNYRSWIFETEGSRRSFLACLRQCCEAQGWLLHAWVVMGNHFHLCIETPHPNLVEGMRWLQSTFSNRFNRFRKVNGHVFQGRYKAILLDGEAVGPVCHYIHLNPVRAGLTACDGLQDYVDGSFHQLRERYLAPNRWIAERLHMGAVSTVQSLISRHRENGGGSDSNWRKVKNHETLDLYLGGMMNGTSSENGNLTRRRKKIHSSFPCFSCWVRPSWTGVGSLPNPWVSLVRSTCFSKLEPLDEQFT
jgi:REP element-mobilizing transposase RayT